MKLTKQVFKKVVKECLMEILSEGLGDGKVSVKPRKVRTSPTPRSRAPDLVQFNNAINETVGNLTNDPVMASIFADTAKTTLQEQINMDPHTRGSQMGGTAFSDGTEKIDDPEEIFGEAAEKWAALAFSEKKT